MLIDKIRLDSTLYWASPEELTKSDGFRISADFSKLRRMIKDYGDGTGIRPAFVELRKHVTGGTFQTNGRQAHDTQSHFITKIEHLAENLIDKIKT